MLGTDPTKDEGAHLYLTMTAAVYPICDNLGKWLAVANDYRVAALPAKTAVKKSNDIVAARAIHLRAAIIRLLDLAGAPSAMISDADTLLAPLCPKGAEQRGKSQKAIIDDPDAGVRGAAREAKVSAGQISNDRKAGVIATPTDGVWSHPD